MLAAVKLDMVVIQQVLDLFHPITLSVLGCGGRNRPKNTAIARHKYPILRSNPANSCTTLAYPNLLYYIGPTLMPTRACVRDPVDHRRFLSNAGAVDGLFFESSLSRDGICLHAYTTVDPRPLNRGS